MVEQIEIWPKLLKQNKLNKLHIYSKLPDKHTLINLKIIDFFTKLCFFQYLREYTIIYNNVKYRFITQVNS